MIARLTVGTPFVMFIPEGEQFSVYSYESDGYEISSIVPVRSDLPIFAQLPEEVSVNDKPAFAANAIRFDFRKETFDRRRAFPQSDPPEELIQRVIDSFIARLRYVTRAPQIQPIVFPSGTSWRLQYLDDSGAEFTEDPQFIRARFGRAFNVSYIALAPSVWDNVFALEADWSPPVWDTILLDAHRSLPHVGSAVVLGATALEVFIGDVLSKLQALKPIPADFWAWVNDRDNWLKDPSTEERFDFLLGHYCAHSLKEDPVLWSAFRNLRQARNTFVHEGIARVGNDCVDPQRALDLLVAARAIVSRVRDWLPPTARWPEFPPTATTSMVMPIIKGAPPHP